jgi:hypothetical protein
MPWPDPYEADAPLFDQPPREALTRVEQLGRLGDGQQPFGWRMFSVVSHAALPVAERSCCWPVPQNLAGQLAASFPGLTLRTQQARRQRLRPPAARPGRRRMLRGAARRDDNGGQRRYVCAAGDPDTEGYFDASG